MDGSSASAARRPIPDAAPKPNRPRISDQGFALICGAILLFEAIGLLAFGVEGRHHPLGGDGPQYEMYAQNLLDHGTFSDARSPPYAPSVFRTPGYPIFLTALRLVGGSSLLLVRIAQFLIVGATAWLVFLIARDIADRESARVAALMCVTYLPLLEFARIHGTEVLSAFLATGIVFFLIKAFRRGRQASPALYALIGGITGIATLVRPGFALLVVPLVVGVVARSGTAISRRMAAMRVVALVAAFVLVLTPWTVRNYSVAHEFLPLGTASGSSLLASALQWKGRLAMNFTGPTVDNLFNADQARASAIKRENVRRASPIPNRTRLEIDIGDKNRSLAGEVFKQISFGDVARRLPTREAWLWSVADQPPRMAESWWHLVGRLQYLVLGVLLVAGMIAMRKGRIDFSLVWPLLLVPAYLSVLHLVFHVETRYTVPARPSLLVISGIGLTYLWRLRRTRQRDQNAMPSPRALRT